MARPKVRGLKTLPNGKVAGAASDAQWRARARCTDDTTPVSPQGSTAQGCIWHGAHWQDTRLGKMACKHETAGQPVNIGHYPNPRPMACVIALLVIGLAVLAGFASRSAAAEDEPRAAVESLHTLLLGVMREADTVGFDDRRKKLAPVLENSFDFAYISRLVLGPEWTKLDEAGQARMEEALTALTLDTYAARFDGYQGERFETVDSKESKRGRWLVRTHLLSPQEGEVALDYLLHRTGDRWRIVNVIANGVSDLSIKRAEYAGIVKSKGFDHLIDAITRQREEMAVKARKAGPS